MSEPTLSIAIDAPTSADGLPVLNPGSRVTATIRLDDGGPARGLRWRLFWETEGKGDSEAEVAASGDVPGDASWRVSIEVPAGPWSYAGTLLKLHWFFEASVVLGATVLDAEQRVLVVPPGRASSSGGDAP